MPIHLAHRCFLFLRPGNQTGNTPEKVAHEAVDHPRHGHVCCMGLLAGSFQSLNFGAGYVLHIQRDTARLLDEIAKDIRVFAVLSSW